MGGLGWSFGCLDALLASYLFILARFLWFLHRSRALGLSSQLVQKSWHSEKCSSYRSGAPDEAWNLQIDFGTKVCPKMTPVILNRKKKLSGPNLKSRKDLRFDQISNLSDMLNRLDLYSSHGNDFWTDRSLLKRAFDRCKNEFRPMSIDPFYKDKLFGSNLRFEIQVWDLTPNSAQIWDSDH